MARRKRNKAPNKERKDLATNENQVNLNRLDGTGQLMEQETVQNLSSDMPVDSMAVLGSITVGPIDRALENIEEGQTLQFEERETDFSTRENNFKHSPNASSNTEFIYDEVEVPLSEGDLLDVSNATVIREGEIKQYEAESIQQQLEKSVENCFDLELKNSELEHKLRPLGAQIGKLKDRLKIKDEELFEANLNVENLVDEKETLLRMLAVYKEKETEQFKKNEGLMRQYQSLQNLEEALNQLAAEFGPERVKELEIENDSLKRQNKIMQDELDERGALLDLLEKDLKKYSRKDYEVLRSENLSLSKQLEELSGELEEYRQNTNNLIHLKTVIASAERSEKERIDLLQRVEYLSRELEETKSQIAQDKTDRALYERAKLQVEELRQVLENQSNIEANRLHENARVYDSLNNLVQRTEYTNFKKMLSSWPGDGTIFNKIKTHAVSNQFSFEDHLIRAFLAAVRSSRMIILKGFSGTGKSSLPQLVASAIGAPCEVIPVQPNWKSKVDLLGFYNHFDQRFVPTAFTKALIKSLLPAFQDRHFFILLDEMNLARVEYYFSDFNSKLQSSDPKIELFEGASVHPRLTLEGGKTLIDGNTITIPDNVTFIGTINDDETTFSISDKIYDRTQVIDFQNVGDEILKGKIPPHNPKGDVFSYSTFKEIWDRSSLPEADREKIEKFLQGLNGKLKEKFYLNLSYRPRNQIVEFIQAYLMSGGTLSEALDLQMVSKVVPKIRYTHHGDFKENLDQFKASLQKDWPFNPKTLPYTEHALDALSQQG